MILSKTNQLLKDKARAKVTHIVTYEAEWVNPDTDEIEIRDFSVDHSELNPSEQVIDDLLYALADKGRYSFKEIKRVKVES